MNATSLALRLAGGAGLVAMLSCGGGGGGSSTPAPSGPAPGHVWVGSDPGGYGSGSMSFTPSNLNVTAGTTVTWDFLGGPHTVTSGVPGTPDGVYDSGSMSSGTFTHAFATAGTYHYYCTIHGSMMTGTVTVN